jgi:hypothetical protein
MRIEPSVSTEADRERIERRTDPGVDSPPPYLIQAYCA